MLPVAVVRMTFRDVTGSLGYVSDYVPAALEIGAARAAVEGLIAALSDVSTATFEGYSITYREIKSEGKGTGDGGRVLVLVLVCEGDSQRAVVSVPAPLGMLVEADGDVDTDSPIVQAIVDELVAGPWCNPFGAKITALETAYIGEDR